MSYKHTQRGYLIIIAFVITISIFIITLIQTGYDIPILTFMLLVLFLLASFISLTVSVDKKYLKVKFGYGIFRKRLVLKDIISAKTVKNSWIYGWGVRIWFWPHMRIYNVSGYDAVELKMKDNKTFRIGTDEPQKLFKAINKVIKKH